MKVLIKLIGLVLIFIISYSLSIFFNKKEIKANDKKETSISFNIKEYDFSAIKKDVPVSKYFVYQNLGSDFFKIKRINISCGCTIPVWSRKELASGEKDSILIKYDSKKEGHFSKSIYIISNSDTSPDVLYIKGVVKK